jgi:lysophospholipase L1-like esterase
VSAIGITRSILLPLETSGLSLAGCREVIEILSKFLKESIPMVHRNKNLYRLIVVFSILALTMCAQSNNEGRNTDNDLDDSDYGDGGADTDANSDTVADSDTDMDYNPCPTDGSACKILPLGDSITWGVGDEGNAGYRGPLFALAEVAEQNITFTGSLSNGPSIVSDWTFPKRNEGHSGWGISTVTQYSNGNAGIASVIPSPAFDNDNGGTPNIILLHIGTNDATESTADEMTDRLASLMDQIMDAAPDALLLVAEIRPLSWAESVINAYNKEIPGLVQTRAAAGGHIVFVDMNTGFDSSTMINSDNIHPNSEGYQFMADRWYSVIGPLLPE